MWNFDVYGRVVKQTTFSKKKKISLQCHAGTIYTNTIAKIKYLKNTKIYLSKFLTVCLPIIDECLLISGYNFLHFLRQSYLKITLFFLFFLQFLMLLLHQLLTGSLTYLHQEIYYTPIVFLFKCRNKLKNIFLFLFIRQFQLQLILHIQKLIFDYLILCIK